MSVNILLRIVLHNLETNKVWIFLNTLKLATFWNETCFDLDG